MDGLHLCPLNRRLKLLIMIKEKNDKDFISLVWIVLLIRVLTHNHVK